MSFFKNIANKVFGKKSDKKDADNAATVESEIAKSTQSKAEIDKHRQQASENLQQQPEDSAPPTSPEPDDGGGAIGAAPENPAAKKDREYVDINQLPGADDGSPNLFKKTTKKASADQKKRQYIDIKERREGGLNLFKQAYVKDPSKEYQDLDELIEDQEPSVDYDQNLTEDLVRHQQLIEAKPKLPIYDEDGNPIKYRPPENKAARHEGVLESKLKRDREAKKQAKKSRFDDFDFLNPMEPPEHPRYRSNKKAQPKSQSVFAKLFEQSKSAQKRLSESPRRDADKPALIETSATDEAGKDAARAAMRDKIKAKLAQQEGKNDIADPAKELAEAEKVLLTTEDLENLEEELIKADLGVNITWDFLESIRDDVKKGLIYQDDLPPRLEKFLLKAFVGIKGGKNPFKFELKKPGLTVVLVLGVNGVGKTTSIGKLSHKFKCEGNKVLVAAGDTFRAAAENQLKFWAELAEVDLIELQEGAKSSTVTFKAIEEAKRYKHDVLIIDTAGRLHNKKNLMEELSKIKQVISKNLANVDYRLETMLVLDSSMGQNSLVQAETFKEICDVDSIFLSKFDGSAKAGVVFAIAHKLKLPVKFMGTGEKLENMEEFSPRRFINKYFK
jgi:fused signal recognition particle receptor